MNDAAEAFGLVHNRHLPVSTGPNALEFRTPTAFDLAMSIQGALGGLEHEGTARFYSKVIIPNLELKGF